MPIELSPGAEDELWNIWSFNVQRYGRQHADEYILFLRQSIEGLGERHGEGRPLEGFPGLRTVTFRKRPRGDGHIAVYEIDEAAQTITVLHVFHSKKDLRGRISQDL